MTQKRLFGSILLFGLFIFASAQAGPNRINYQGRLTNAAGEPITNPSLPMNFAIWDKAGPETMQVMNQITMLMQTNPVQLGPDNVVPGSEHVTVVGGSTVFTRDVDYTMDYPDGTIARIEGGAIPDLYPVEIDFQWIDPDLELWRESKTVAVTDGIYSVILGDPGALKPEVFAADTLFLQIIADGETLSPRQRLTAVAYAMDSTMLDGLSASAFARSPHNHDASAITTGQLVEARYSCINDLIAEGLLDNDTASDIATFLQADARYVNTTGDDAMAGDLAINGGNLGLGLAPSNTYSLLNNSAGTQSTGGLLYGLSEGVRGAYSADPQDHYGFLGGPSVAVFGLCGDSVTDSSARWGAILRAESQTEATGLQAVAMARGSSPVNGVLADATNSGAGVANGGYFEASEPGLGAHAGVQGMAYANSGADTYGVYGRARNLGGGDVFGGYFEAIQQGAGTHYGVYAVGFGNLLGAVYGVKSMASNASTNPASSSYGGFYSSYSGAPTDYGIYANAEDYAGYFTWGADPEDHYAFLATNAIGMSAKSGAADETGTRYGGYFIAETQGMARGLFAASTSHGPIAAYGVDVAATNDGAGIATAGVFTANVPGSGAHIGVDAKSYANSSAQSFGVGGYAQNQGTGEVYAGRFEANVIGSGVHYGVLAYASGQNAVYGIKATADNDVGPAYGGHFSTQGNSNSNHYAVYAESFVDIFDLNPLYRYGVYSTVTSDVLGHTVYGIYARAEGPGTNVGLQVAAGTKNWVNPDPEDPSQSVRYATLEGGENGTYWRGTAQLDKGRAEIILPDHFRKVTSPDYPVTVTVTPRDDCNGLMIVQSDNQKIVIKELMSGQSNARFDFIVMGKRLGYEEYEPIIPNDDYIPFQGNLQNLDPNSTTTQEWYDRQHDGLKKIYKANGTLTKDGKVNDALFKNKGWKNVE